ncbi:MAG: H-X9-DG-CTERM domain-containing protein [Planctomycetota bacterium]
MYQAYGRNRASKSTSLNVIGGLVARTVDDHGNFYAPNDCPYSSMTIIDDRVPPAADFRQKNSQVLPNFRSSHRGIVHMLLTDGSVEGVNDGIDGHIFVRRSTMAGSDMP